MLSNVKLTKEKCNCRNEAGESTRVFKDVSANVFLCVSAQNRVVPKRSAYTLVIKSHLSLKLVPSVKHANISILFANSASPLITKPLRKYISPNLSLIRLLMCFVWSLFRL